jgi:RNA polymerase sigma-70 factor (ECF subfamily)
MDTVAAPEAVDVERYRRELTGYCYRMLGSAFDAEDAVQETMLRAWRAAEDFEGRSSVRSWLYRIATNVCLDLLRSPQRRAVPTDLSAPWSADTPLPAPLPEQTWVSPIADERVLPAEADPAELAMLKDSVRLAFVAALQHLPPRQRAVLVLREVLRWKADEVADLLDTSVASVNSALQRARATMADKQPRGQAPDPLDPEHVALLQRYVEAFERYDISALVALLHEDATQCMPPWSLWLSGPEDIGAWHLGPGGGCRGSKVVELRVNGTIGYAQYKPSGEGDLVPWAIHLLEVADGKITSITNFVGPRLFAAFGLPERLDA